VTTYLLRRILQSIIFVAVAALLIYTLLVMLMPDGPADRYNRLKAGLPDRFTGAVPLNTTPERGDPAYNLQVRYKLDKPWPLNFAVWLFDPNDTEINTYDLAGNPIVVQKGINLQLFGLTLRGSGILTGDFGKSEGFAPNVTISQIFADRWMNTIILLGTSLLLALLVGIPLGIMGALRHRSPLDHSITFFSLGGLSLPPFVLGLLLIIFFAVLPKALRDENGWDWLPWLPAGGLGEPGNFWSKVSHLVLPAITLAIPQIALLSRYTRFAMLDVLGQDYIRTAWAKGLGRRQVVLKHALRNTLLPLITQIALLIPLLVSGAVVIETVFAYEGIGKAFYRALGGCLASASMMTQDPPPCPRVGYFPIDYPLALVLLFLMIVVVAVSNILADIAYAVADPRISYEAAAGKRS
jgi:peptide/nickel transport system permease protein